LPFARFEFEFGFGYEFEFEFECGFEVGVCGDAVFAGAAIGRGGAGLGPALRPALVRSVAGGNAAFPAESACRRASDAARPPISEAKDADMPSVP
jgi:hypothetical protein